MSYIDVTGKTEEEAIRKALQQLQMDRDDVSVEILERAKSGFLGIGSSPARVRVTYGQQEPEAPAAPVQPEKKPEKKPEPKPQQPKPQKAEAPKAAPKAPEAPKAAETPAAPAQELCQDDNARRITEFLTGLLEHMDSPAQVKVTETEKGRYSVVLEGQKLGQLIGRRGETLDAIQYLASLVANRGEGEYIRLSIDSGNYREKRARTLEALARKLANQAVRTGRSITLEPMNPYERRIIHGAVSTVKGATSSSTGVEPNRRVVISSTVPPTGGKEGSREGGRGGRNGRGGSRRGNGGRGNGGERRSRPAGERRPRLEDPPAIGGPVRREQAETAPKSEKSAVEQEILSANTGKRYGKIDI